MRSNAPQPIGSVVPLIVVRIGLAAIEYHRCRARNLSGREASLAIAEARAIERALAGLIDQRRAA